MQIPNNNRLGTGYRRMAPGSRMRNTNTTALKVRYLGKS